MKILMITQKVDPADPILGFAAKWLKAIAACAAKLTVVTLEQRGGAWPANVEIYSLGKESGLNRWQRSGRLFRFANQRLARREFDLIFCHMCPAYVIFLSPWAKALNIPLTLWYAHGEQSCRLKLALLLADKVFTPSARSFPLPSPKVTLLGHGIPTGEFDFPVKSESGPLNIVTIGRITPRKDQLTFLKAAATSRENNSLPNAKFYIIGSPLHKSDEAYWRQLQSYWQEKQLTSLVEFVPACAGAELKKWYQKSDMLVNTSLTGSLDKVILEALAARRPIFTSNEAGRDLLAPLCSLLTFPAGDYQTLSQNLAAWQKSDRQKRQDLLEELRQLVVKDHDLERLAEKLVAEFGQLLKIRNLF